MGLAKIRSPLESSFFSPDALVSLDPLGDVDLGASDAAVRAGEVGVTLASPEEESFEGASDLASGLDSALSEASASAPERSSPSSATMAMGVPTLTPLLPSPT